MIHRRSLLLAALAPMVGAPLTLPAAPAGAGGFLDWGALRNPIYEHEGWAVKDCCMVWHDGWFHIFTGAYFFDRGQERSHIIQIRSRDMKAWSEPRFLFDTPGQGWIGHTSPDITRQGDTWVITYNSWGDKEGQPNQLFYAVSKDLEHWDFGKPLAASLTVGPDGKPERAIDAAIAQSGGTLYLMWKGGRKPMRTRLAVAPALEGPWRFAGDGFPNFRIPEGLGAPNHENYEFMRVDGRWRLVTTDYKPQTPRIYAVTGEAGARPEPPERDWLDWTLLHPMEMPPERFNTHERANAPFIADWRGHDGNFYCLYAGTTEGETHKGRGDNRLALARSRDLKTWEAPPGK